MALPLVCPRQDEPISEIDPLTEEKPRLFGRSWYLQIHELFERARAIWELLTGGTVGQVLISGGPGVPAAFGALTTITAQAGANTPLTVTLADITGATVTLSTGTWLVRACVRLFYNVESQGVVIVGNVGGADIELDSGLGAANPTIVSSLVTGTLSDIWIGMGSQQWRVTVTGSAIFKLRGAKNFTGGGSSAFAGGPNTTIEALRVG